MKEGMRHNPTNVFKETGMDCKNCPDRKFCYTAPNTWPISDQRESAAILLRVLRCRSGFGKR